MREITIPMPFNGHIHLRDGQDLKDVIEHVWPFTEVVVMPNLLVPILSWDDAEVYRERIHAAFHGKNWNNDFFAAFQALVSIQLTEKTTAKVVREAVENGYGQFKMYPQHGTTNSEFGVINYFKVRPAIAAMEELGCTLMCHDEVPDPTGNIEPRYRELAFMPIITMIHKEFPLLRLSAEHVGCGEMTLMIEDMPENVGYTVTPHHLIKSAIDVRGGKYQTDLHCMPCIKDPKDRVVLRRCVTKKGSKAAYGDDSAPHRQQTKYSPSCCAGVFHTGREGVSVVAQVFDEEDSFDNLEEFLCTNGRRLHNLSNSVLPKIKIVERPWTVPNTYGDFTPFMAGETLRFDVEQIP